MCEVAERVSDETIRKLEALTTGWRLITIQQLLAERAADRERIARVENDCVTRAYRIAQLEVLLEAAMGHVSFIPRVLRNEIEDALKPKNEPDSSDKE